MKMLTVAGEPGKGFKFLCGAVVKQMYIGAAVSGGTTEPALVLDYPVEAIPLVKTVTSEMARRNVSPKVHIVPMGGAYEVIVLFVMKEVEDVNFLTRVLPASELREVQRMVGSERMTVIMTGEASFDQPGSSRKMREFLGHFRQTGKFMLLVGPDASAPAETWSVELTEIVKSYPNPDELL